jgi:hypothetical protein
MVVIAAFDLGIKNLSYCVAEFDGSGGLVGIRRWANLNLLADGAEAQSQTRCGCGGPASWANRVEGGATTIWCKKCVKKGAAGTKPVLDIAVKAPKLADWRAWAPTGLGVTEAEAKKMTKATLEERAAAIRLMPYKAPKAKGVTLQSLLAAMEVCLDSELTWLAAADRIRLENQPSEFAPHMKSVQIMLFTLIDHRLRAEKGWAGTMEFVSASVKTRGAAVAAGKENKRARKVAGIERVTKLLTETGGGSLEHLAWWSGQAKRDDLADALLMCVDGAAV